MEAEKSCQVCPLAETMEVIGSKWKPLILFHLREGAERSGALQRRVKGITNKMFTQSIRELEADGLVDRKVFPVVPPKVEYTLSAKGRTLLPILEQLDQWGREVLLAGMV